MSVEGAVLAVEVACRNKEPLHALVRPQPRLALIAKAVRALVGDASLDVCIDNRGFLQLRTLGPVRPRARAQPTNEEHTPTTVEREATHIVTLTRRLHLSWRQAEMLDRKCSFPDVIAAREALTPYVACPVVVTSDTGAARCAAYAPLIGIVRQFVRLAESLHVEPVLQAPYPLLITLDATALWHRGATRCDVFLHIWPEHSAVTNLALWATWWAMDGPDDAAFLQAMDKHINADLNELLDQEGVTF